MWPFFLVSMITFGISSMWLYSPGPSPIRVWWVKWMGKIGLGPLAYCQLCCSFWIAAGVQVLLYGFPGWVSLFLVSCGASGMSWLLGSIANFFLWGKAWFEKEF